MRGDPNRVALTLQTVCKRSGKFDQRTLLGVRSTSDLHGPNTPSPSSTTGTVNTTLHVVERFRLRPLTRSTCTRVLTIRPSHNVKDPVHLDVDEIDLAGQFKPFVAISHVWGSDPRYTRVVLCNGKPYRVTGRVDSILHRMRAKMVQDEQCRHWNRIWIDTICIDQSDNARALDEKSHQVSIMHEIFGNAKEVVVDLGRADRFSYLLPGAMRDIKLLRERAFDDEFCKHILGFQSTVDVNAEESRRIRRSLEACSRLLDKQWFARIWAIQEYALARNSTFLLGNVRVDGHLLMELGKLASEANVKGRSHLGMLFNRFRRSLALTKLPRLASIRQNGHIDNKQRLTLGESLGLGWHHDSTDERDVVYALRALVDYGGSPLKIDYNEPATMLTQRVSQKLLELGDHEALLAGAKGLSSDVGNCEPSWAFRLRVPFKFIGEERHWILSGKPTRYEAGGPPGTPLSMLRTPNGQRNAQATVKVIGEIKIITDQFPDIPQYGANIKLPVERLFTYNTERTIHTRAVIVDAWLQHIIPILNQYRKSQILTRRSSELWKVITHGHNAMEFKSNDKTTQDRVDYWLMLADLSLEGLKEIGYETTQGLPLAGVIDTLEIAMRKRHALLAEAAGRPSEWLDEIHRDFVVSSGAKEVTSGQLQTKSTGDAKQNPILPIDSHEAMIKRVLFNTYRVNGAFDLRKVRPPDQLKMIGRRVCVLMDGRLASVPHTTEANDIIVIFKGISVPYVLRKVGEKYKLVGMAYVDGIMHGEAINKDTKWQTIVLE